MTASKLIGEIIGNGLIACPVGFAIGYYVYLIYPWVVGVIK